MHSWFVKNTDWCVYIKKNNMISLQNMFLHLAKQEDSSPVLAELIQDILEWHNIIMRKHNWDLQSRSTQNSRHSAGLCCALFNFLTSLVCLPENGNCTHTQLHSLSSLCLSQKLKENYWCAIPYHKKMIKSISLLAEIYPHENYPALVQPDLCKRLLMRDF